MRKRRDKMSYCVNCGVELENGVKSCPLCDVAVINPAEKDKIPTAPAYPQRLEIPKALNRRFIAFILSMVLIIPNIVVALVKFLFVESLPTPFIYCGSALCWVLFVLPLLFRKAKPFLIWFVDTVAVLAATWFIYYLVPDGGWFIPLALPIILSFSFCVGLLMVLFGFYRDGPIRTIITLAVMSFFGIILDVAINRFVGGEKLLGVSLIVSACFVALMVFFTVVAKSRRFRAWVTRKFFV